MGVRSPWGAAIIHRRSTRSPRRRRSTAIGPSRGRTATLSPRWYPLRSWLPPSRRNAAVRSLRVQEASEVHTGRNLRPERLLSGLCVALMADVHGRTRHHAQTVRRRPYSSSGILPHSRPWGQSVAVRRAGRRLVHLLVGRRGGFRMWPQAVPPPRVSVFRSCDRNSVSVRCYTLAVLTSLGGGPGPPSYRRFWSPFRPALPGDYLLAADELVPANVVECFQNPWTGRRFGRTPLG